MIKIVIFSLIISTTLQLSTAFATLTPSDYLKQSQVAMEAGKIYVALDLLQQAEQQSNTPTELWLINIAIADALFRHGQIEAAEAKLDTVYRKLKNGDNPAIYSEVMLRLGHISVARHKTYKAKARYKEVLKLAKRRNDHAQIVVALIGLSKVSNDKSLLVQAADHIQQINDPVLHQQLLIALAYQAGKQGQIQLAHQALQRVIDQPVNTRFKSQAEGLMGELYVLQNRPEEALQLTEYALLSDNSPDLQLQWTWKRARLLGKAMKKEQALLAYRIAIQQLQQLRIDIPVTYDDGKSSFNQTFAPLYTDFIEALLQQAEHGNAVQQQKLLAEVVQIWEQLKAFELQDYFRNACAVKQQQEKTVLDVGTAILYPMLLSDHLALVVRFSDHTRAYSVLQPPRKITERVQGIKNAIFSNGKAVLDKSQALLKDSQQLYQWLIAPIAADLQQQKIQTLVYLPDAALRKIPFALLHDGQHYLIEQYALVTVPGLSMLAERSTEVNKKDILLAGMSEAGPVVRELSNSDFDYFDGLTEEQLRLRLALPYVNQELKTLSSISDAPVLENSDFILKQFKQQVHQGHSIIHIASHAFLSGDPEKSFIMTSDHLLNMQQ